MEHHFGLHRLMSGAKPYFRSSNIRNGTSSKGFKHIENFSSHPESSIHSLQEIIQLFSSSDNVESQTDTNLDPFLSEISNLSIIEFDTQLLQSLAFIAGYQCSTKSIYAGGYTKPPLFFSGGYKPPVAK